MNSIGISESSDLFRCVNERIVDLAAPLMTARELLWLICECPNDGCTQTMRMTRREYDAMRVQPGLYALVPGHEQRELEEIVGRTDRYVLVRTLHAPATQEAASL
jgi:hypothetical protein